MNSELKANINDYVGLKEMVQKAFKLAKTPIIIAFGITPLRFILELAGFPENIIFIVGLLWLTLAFAIYWGIKLFRQKHPFLLMLLSLSIFAPISRLTVVAAWWIDTRWEIGTHYGLYFDGWIQALLNHIFYGSLVQIIPGFILGSLTIVFMFYRPSLKK